MNFVCQICGTENNDPDETGYGGPYLCKCCGQKYEYDECISIVLSEEQLKVLRQLRTGMEMRIP